MDFFDFLTLLGGLALFLFGMNTMGDGLAKTAGSKLEKILERLTSNPIKGVLLGAGVTAVIQSSSATTVMVVGFVNSGIMKLSQAVGVIMGANIGTTVTSWILSLTGIESTNFFIRMLKPSSFSPILAIIGVILLLFMKDEKKKDIGTIMVGFAVLMFGMETMSGAVEPLAEVPAFTNLFVAFKNPLLGMLVGAVLTAIIQSSSASVGILQAMCMTGAVSFGAAIPIIMGQNIGTCITAILSSIGAKKNAKRAALVHLYFNIIGTTVFMIVFYSINAFVHFGFLDEPASVLGVAVVHSSFNVAATMILLPFSKGLEKLACLTIRDGEKDREDREDEELLALDNRFLDKPAFAVGQVENATVKMALLTKDCIYGALDMLFAYDKKKAEQVIALETKLDHYEDCIGSYLVKLSAKDLSERDSQSVSINLHCINDFERISDHAVNILDSIKEMDEKAEHFSEKAVEELTIFREALKEVVDIAVDVFQTGDISKAKTVEPLEEAIDRLQDQLRKRHMKRLQKGKCNAELGMVLSDLLTNFERVADHCSNIAVCLIEVKDDEFDTHEYLDNMKQENPQFRKLYKEYKKKYDLP